jgi:hypothetical protein
MYFMAAEKCQNAKPCKHQYTSYCSTSSIMAMQTCHSSDSLPLPAEHNAATASVPAASWPPEDEEGMILFLISKKNAAVDGANFRPVIWNMLIKEMVKHHTKGGPKTVAACKSKYSQVCTILLFLDHQPTLSSSGQPIIWSLL